MKTIKQIEMFDMEDYFEKIYSLCNLLITINLSDISFYHPINIVALIHIQGIQNN